jgi:hypothetical protein
MHHEINIHTQDIINRQEIATEYQYLQNIISELRDQSESKKIFGLVVDRLMLSRIFGGVAAVIYLVGTTVFLSHFYMKPEHFTKTGSGQT